MIDLLCVGEALVVGRVPTGGLGDSVPIGIAGAELNVALAASYAGNTVHYATRIGSDPFGDSIRSFLMRERIPALLETDDTARTGFYLRTLQRQGRDAHYFRDGSAGSRLPSIAALQHRVQESRIMHTTGVTAALDQGNAATLIHLMSQARAHGCRVSFDVNFRSKLWSAPRAAEVIHAIAQCADLVFVGADEAEELWGARSLDELSSILGPPELVYKDSDRQMVSVRTDAGPIETPVGTVDVVDSVGAGDAFAAGYLHAELAGMADPPSRVRLGHAFATAILCSTNDALDREGVKRALGALLTEGELRVRDDRGEQTRQ